MAYFSLVYTVLLNCPDSHRCNGAARRVRTCTPAVIAGKPVIVGTPRIMVGKPAVIGSTPSVIAGIVCTPAGPPYVLYIISACNPEIIYIYIFFLEMTYNFKDNLGKSFYQK